MIHFTNLTHQQIDTDGLGSLGQKILAAEDIGAHEEINCIFTDNSHIQKLNLRYLKKNRPTDVLAFSFVEGEDTGFRDKIFGDIYISVETAKKNAEEYGQALTEELRLLFVHGLLHLLGYGDETEEERNTMRSKEQQYLGLS